jgi:hypothetical protein
LHLAEKTVGNHVEHIYTKIGSSTRAEASLFAMQHGLLDLTLPAEKMRSSPHDSAALKS